MKVKYEHRDRIEANFIGTNTVKRKLGEQKRFDTSVVLTVNYAN